jgi:hypothetical protein
LHIPDTVIDGVTSREFIIGAAIIGYIYSPILVALLAYPVVGPITISGSMVAWMYVMGTYIAIAAKIMHFIGASN